jgi:DNA-binding response OmpR family regulator
MADVDGKTILVVDDDSDSLIFLKLVLEAQGYRVLLASGTETALRVLRRADLAVDVMLTNSILPGSNGRDLMSRGRELRPSLPTLFMSRFNDREAVRLKVWDAAVLEKHAGDAEFLGKIRDFLGATPMPSHRPQRAFRATV